MSVTVPSPILAPPSAYDPLKNVIVTPGDPATNYVVVLVEEYVGDNVSDYDTSPSIRQVDRITGTLGDDFISTRLGADFIYGEGGNDVIRAGNGDDTISGGSGADRLYGGRGANTFLSEIDGFIDTIYLTAGQEQAPGNGKGQEDLVDTITGVDRNDKIILQSTTDKTTKRDLIENFVPVFGPVGQSIGLSPNTVGVPYLNPRIDVMSGSKGLEIYCDQQLEFIYTGGNLTTWELHSMIDVQDITVNPSTSLFSSNDPLGLMTA